MDATAHLEHCTWECLQRLAVNVPYHLLPLTSGCVRYNLVQS